MKNIKNLFIAIIGVLSFQYVQAQGTMKDPVSFKLKNGINVIVAENAGMGKVYASFKIEGEPVSGTGNEGIAAEVNNLLNEEVATKSKIAFEHHANEMVPKVSLTSEEGNVAAATEDFENAFTVMSTTVQSQSILNTSEELKAYYNQQMTPSRVYITIAGDITLAEAKALLKKAFGDWKNSAETATLSK